MRIITGTARGIRLETPEGEDTRPTLERVKEAVFSSIQFDIEGRRFLDLFSGSGQNALEALSRGAALAVMVDSSPEAIAVMKTNAKKAKLFDRCRIVNYQYDTYLRGAAGREQFDLIYLDPPFGGDTLREVLRKLDRSGVAAPHAIIVCETESPDIFEGDMELASRYCVQKNTKYGRIHVTYLTPALADGNGKL